MSKKPSKQQQVDPVLLELVKIRELLGKFMEKVETNDKRISRLEKLVIVAAGAIISKVLL
jgi:hypothetical protein